MKYIKRAAFRLRRLFTLGGYATAPVWLQLIILVFFSGMLILLFAPLWGSLKKSYLMFVDQSAFIEAEGWFRVGLGFVEVIIGIMVAGFIISILTSTLASFIREIQTGSLSYKRSNHVVIVNQNNKLFHILRELNKKFEDMARLQDVVILLKGKQQVQAFWDAYSVERHPNLAVYVKYGIPLFFESFKKVALLQASAAVILLDKDYQDQYDADNFSIKILTTILGNNDYRALLVRRSREKNPLRCTIELHSTCRAKQIAASISTVNNVSTFSVVTPLNMITRILSRCVIEIAYFKIYSEIFSFRGHEIYFVNPRRWSNSADFVGKTFEELHLSFGKGLLIGFSRVAGNDFEILLNPFQEKLLDEDWFVFLSREEKAIVYDDSISSLSNYQPTSMSLKQPSEIVARKICMIGNYQDLGSTDEFLDKESKKQFHGNIIVCDKAEDYFDEDKIAQLKAKNFDNIIINLKDEIALRFTLFIHSLHGQDSQFISKLIVIIENPVTAEILAASDKHENIILSEKLAANFIGQITFQKSLIHVLEELTSPAGNEFNLLEIGKDLSPDLLTNKWDLKKLLIDNKMTYVGTVNEKKDVEFDTDSFENATHVIVLSAGIE